MKRIISIGILIFILTGCSSGGPVSDKDTSVKLHKSNTDEVEAIEKTKENTSAEQNISKEEPEYKELETTVQDKVEDNKTDIKEDTQKENEPKPEQQETEVIAKSNNDVTSKEKEEILNEINKLLDDVFKNIDDMDSIKDEDLVIED